MFKLQLLLIGLLVTLVACGNQIEETPIATVEVTPEITPALELTETYRFDLGWGGQVAFDYPVSWQVRTQSSIGIHSEDGYSITLTADNNPNTNNDAENQLDRMNQTSDILTTEVNGVTIYYSFLSRSNRYAATVQLDDETIAIFQMFNTRSRDLEPLLDTFFAVVASMRLVEAE